MSSFVAGPTAGRILAELGADVVRVDPITGAVDSGRWPVTEDGASLYWAGLNQGKRSVTVDLHSAAGREFVTALVVDAGILLENAAHAPWLDNATLTTRRADLIHLHIEGHPDGSPAVDYTVNAEVGLPLMTGPRAYREPVNHVLPAWDLLTGLYAALGLVTAVRRRERSGAGAYLQLALGDVALSAVASMGWVAEADRYGNCRPRQGNALYGSYGADFPTADSRAVMVVGLTRSQWQALVDITETGDIFAALQQHRGLDLSIESDRYAARDAITAVLRPWFASRTLAQIEAALTGTRVLWSSYRTLAEVVARIRADEACSAVQEVDQPGVGPMLTSRSPLRWAGAYTDAAPSPSFGAHSREVAKEAGLSIAQINQLEHAGILGRKGMP